MAVGGPGAAAERAAREAALRRDARLRAEAPEERRRRGVVATPPRLARAVVALLDARLREDLGLPGGLADPTVALVDPAVGTGPFLAAALAVAGGRGSAPAAVVGRDVDADALALAEEVLRAPFDALGWPLALVSGSALDEPTGGPALDPRLRPVVLGNPPWSGRTANAGASDAWLEDFRVDGEGRRLDERKLGVLSDDYVRFFRVAAERVRCAPAGGALALVTNASFLDGPVHRGMRGALLRWFDALDVVDLGGSALVARSGPRDENLFGVRPGVALTLAVRDPRRGPPRGRLRARELRGAADDKLAALEADRGWLDLPGAPPMHLFRPHLEGGEDLGDWARWAPLPALLPFHREGVQTNRDAFATDPDRARLVARLRAFAAGGTDGALALPSRALGHFSPAHARRVAARVLEDDPDGTAGVAARRLAYRPGEDRWFVPAAPLCHRPRPALLRALDAGPEALLTVRKDRGDRPWAHFGWVTAAPDNCWLSSRSSCRTRAFPVRRPDGSPNVDAARVADWAGAARRTVSAPDLARYALAVLATPAYRARFGAALRLDYPRLPPPASPAHLAALVAAGGRLAEAIAAARPASRGAPGDVIGHRRVNVSGFSGIMEKLDALWCKWPGNQRN